MNEHTLGEHEVEQRLSGHRDELVDTVREQLDVNSVRDRVTRGRRIDSSAGPPSIGAAGRVTGFQADPMRATLALIAPGTALRDGLERILRGRTGALIVLGYDDVV